MFEGVNEPLPGRRVFIASLCNVDELISLAVLITLMNQLARWNAPAKYSGSNPVAQYSKAGKSGWVVSRSVRREVTAGSTGTNSIARRVRRNLTCRTIVYSFETCTFRLQLSSDRESCAHYSSSSCLLSS